MFGSAEELSKRLAETGYFIDPVMTQVVFLAAKLQKPLILEGPAGSGKTQLAVAVAHAAGTQRGAPAMLSGMTEEKAIGHFDDGLRTALPGVLERPARRMGIGAAESQERELHSGRAIDASDRMRSALRASC